MNWKKKLEMYWRVNRWDRALVLWKKNLPGRGLTKVEKHWDRVYFLICWTKGLGCVGLWAKNLAVSRWMTTRMGWMFTCCASRKWGYVWDDYRWLETQWLDNLESEVANWPCNSACENRNEKCDPVQVAALQQHILTSAQTGVQWTLSQFLPNERINYCVADKRYQAVDAIQITPKEHESVCLSSTPSTSI